MRGEEFSPHPSPLTLAAAPPAIDTITSACNRTDLLRRQHENRTQTACSQLESLKNALWQDQLKRDALKISAQEPGANIRDSESLLDHPREILDDTWRSLR